jgi:hypothetical protein
MRIKKLILNNFGPFKEYTLSFADDGEACVLLTGKNNEGKSNIIFALKLLSAACKVVGRQRSRIFLDDDTYYQLLQQDVSGINIGRTLYNYSGDFATVTGSFKGGFGITVHLNEPEDMIYASYAGKIPNDVGEIFGFIPPLGPLAEKEDFLASKSHIMASINTSLAPRHLRNHLLQVLTDDEYSLIQEVIKTTWANVQLLECEHHTDDNSLACFFKEGRNEREMAWAGQGLQVWFQIITHLVRLRHVSILVLDEPEINLHAEKQNDLIRTLKEYHQGSVIIATHSVELMNNVDVSHIVHIQKSRKKPQILSTTERTKLNIVRSQIGSNFNLVASQFEAFDRIIFTEDTSDFAILKKLAEGFDFNGKVYNIPIHGFSEHPKTLSFRDAYRILIGHDTPHAILLDRDYYPQVYLEKTHKFLTAGGLMSLFTPGKEIENIFLAPDVLDQLIPPDHKDEFNEFWEKVFTKERADCYGSFITLHDQFLPKKVDIKTIMKDYTPLFDARWGDKPTRHLIIGGKKALKCLRDFYRKKTGCNLTTEMLIRAVIDSNDQDAKSTVATLWGAAPMSSQVLHY